MKIADEKDLDKEKKVDNAEPISLLLDSVSGDSDEKTRTIALYEEITEESASSVVGALMYLHQTGFYLEQDPEDPEVSEEKCEPIKLVVSSVGGSAHEIETVGLGKVMSAAILILAAGTKGKRKIGKNCRVMLHPVAGGAIGDIQDIENDTKEIKIQQRQYIKCLAEESNLTVKKINSILGKKINQYFSAEEAVEFGIADEII